MNAFTLTCTHSHTCMLSLGLLTLTCSCVPALSHPHIHSHRHVHIVCHIFTQSHNYVCIHSHTFRHSCTQSFIVMLSLTCIPFLGNTQNNSGSGTLPPPCSQSHHPPHTLHEHACSHSTIAFTALLTHALFLRHSLA